MMEIMEIPGGSGGGGSGVSPGLPDPTSITIPQGNGGTTSPIWMGS